MKSMKLFISPKYFGLLMAIVNSGISSIPVFAQDQPKYVLFENEPKTWLEAQSACINEGGHLAVLENEEEAVDVSLFLKSTATSDIAVWVGAEKLSVLDPGLFDFKWVNGAEFVFLTAEIFPWAQFEPNNAGEIENCIEVNNARISAEWNDQDCNTQLGYLCEFEPISDINGENRGNSDQEQERVKVLTALVVSVSAVALLLIAYVVFRKYKYNQTAVQRQVLDTKQNEIDPDQDTQLHNGSSYYWFDIMYPSKRLINRLSKGWFTTTFGRQNLDGLDESGNHQTRIVPSV